MKKATCAVRAGRLPRPYGLSPCSYYPKAKPLDPDIMLANVSAFDQSKPNPLCIPKIITLPGGPLSVRYASIATKFRTAPK